MTKEIQVEDDGAYTVDVPPGTYTVVGHRPTTLTGDKQQDCPATNCRGCHVGQFHLQPGESDRHFAIGHSGGQQTVQRDRLARDDGERLNP